MCSCQRVLQVTLQCHPQRGYTLRLRRSGIHSCATLLNATLLHSTLIFGRLSTTDIASTVCETATGCGSHHVRMLSPLSGTNSAQLEAQATCSEKSYLLLYIPYQESKKDLVRQDCLVEICNTHRLQHLFASECVPLNFSRSQ